MFAARELFNGDLQQDSLDHCWQAIGASYAQPEPAYIEHLLPLIQLSPELRQQSRHRAQRWIHYIREHQHQHWGVEPLLQEFSLNSEEGLALMTLAEALIRIPDSATANALIADRLQSARWQQQHNASELWLNLSHWALGYARGYYQQAPDQSRALNQLVKKLGEPILRHALQRAVALVAGRFVMGEDIYSALDQAQDGLTQGHTFSFDMLGEAAVCAADCQHYQQAYARAIKALGKNESYPENHIAPGISIKLSALHARFEALKGDKMLDELYDASAELVRLARRYDVPLSIDAEEADRLEPTLQIMQRLYQHEARGWGKLGLAVQAYSKRALPVLHWLNQLSRQQGDAIPVRLVKGAYWDAEIKWAQQLGLKDYPVFTHKAATDIHYLACARFLLSEQTEQLIPQFATHNAQTLSQLFSYQPEGGFECQRLHGMGAALYETVTAEQAVHCRIYAPVGPHRELLPYLVRRLLENGANSSFVNQVADPAISEQEISLPADERWRTANTGTRPDKTKDKTTDNSTHKNTNRKTDKSADMSIGTRADNPAIPRPGELYAPRRNSQGINLSLAQSRSRLLKAINAYHGHFYQSAPLIDGQMQAASDADPVSCYSPQNQDTRIGERYDAHADHAHAAVAAVVRALPAWRATPLSERAQVLLNMADQLENQAAELIHLLQQEAGKTLQDAIDEVREAVDFCRYYAAQAQSLMPPRALPGVTGETNQLSLHPRGLFLCISPWNFPLAIFTGQISAALVTGNGVIAKPAQQTSLIAYRCCQLWFEAGLPTAILALLPGPSSAISEPLLNARALDGVAFTGSAASARQINRQLAARDQSALPALIAETGGQNAMLVDSTALPQQVVKDALHSAFGSAGQRCSALRVLYLQEEVADEIIRLLIGAMDELSTDQPQYPTTDVGPVIDKAALKTLQSHLKAMSAQQCILHQSRLGKHTDKGIFLPPTLVQLEHIGQLEAEHFGPILHLIRYRQTELEAVIEEINQTGYGLTLSIHSRNQQLIERLSEQAQVGNIYINRNQTGAVVEAQPFGGRGLSGTGPKAGGPHYLLRFSYEKTLTTNTTAWGGNVDLLAAREPDD